MKQIAEAFRLEICVALIIKNEVCGLRHSGKFFASKAGGIARFTPYYRNTCKVASG
jgi:hypothetical protein